MQNDSRNAPDDQSRPSDSPENAPRSFLAAGSDEESGGEVSTSAFEAAAGMLWRDRNFALGMLGLLVIPDFLQISFQHVGANLFLGLLLFQRVLSLTVCYIIGRRWINLLRQAKLPPNPAALARMYLVGFGFWFLFVVPYFGLVSIAPTEVKFLFLGLFIPAIFLSLRYFFYFVPIALQLPTLKDVFQFAAAFTQGDRNIAIKSMVAPIAFFSLLMSIARLPAPDGRYSYVDYMEALVGNVCWLANIYLCLGFCFVLMDNSTWRNLGFDPYRRARLATMHAQGPGWLASLLQPRNALKVLGVSLLVWLGNLTRLATMPPAADITIAEVQVEGKNLRLDLDLRDEAFRFRSFLPLHFAVAGEKYNQVIQPPLKAHIEGYEDEVDWRFFFPGITQARLTIEFATPYNARDLVKLEDLHLWYRQAKLQRLDMKSARVIGSLDPQPPGAEAAPGSASEANK